MDFNEFYAKEIRFYKDLLVRNVKLYDQRGQELNCIDLSLETLAEKYEKYLDNLPQNNQNDASGHEEEVDLDQEEGEHPEGEEGYQGGENGAEHIREKNNSQVEGQAQKIAQAEMVNYNEYESSMESDVNPKSNQ